MKSRYFELMAEEERLRLGGKGAFKSPEEWKEAFFRRAEFAKSIQAALKAGEITREQHEALTILNRKHHLHGMD